MTTLHAPSQPPRESEHTINTPDFTPPAIAGIILAVITNAIVLVGLDATDAQKAAITGLVNALVVVAFLVHDAVVRHGRATGAPGAAAATRERRV